MGKFRDRWMDRAAEYERILLDEGLSAAKRYMKRYHHKRSHLLNALWELHLEDREEHKKELIRRIEERKRKGSAV